MDGSPQSQAILHDTTLSQPFSLTLDYDNQILYWADYSRNRIEKSNADGSNRQLVTTSLVNDAYGMTYFDGRLYWTDLAYNRILTLPVTSTTSSYLTGSFGDMYDIKVTTEERQPLGECTIVKEGLQLTNYMCMDYK